MNFRERLSKHIVAIVASMAGGALAGGAIVLAVTSQPHSAPTSSSPVAVISTPSPDPTPTPSPDPTPSAAPTAAPTAAPAAPAPVAPAPVAPAPATAAPTAAPTAPPLPPGPAFSAAAVSVETGVAPLAVTWHVDVTGTGPFTIEWTIEGSVFTTTGPNLSQTLAAGTYRLTGLRITDANGRAAQVVLIVGPKVIVS